MKREFLTNAGLEPSCLILNMEPDKDGSGILSMWAAEEPEVGSEIRSNKSLELRDSTGNYNPYRKLKVSEIIDVRDFKAPLWNKDKKENSFYTVRVVPF